MRRKKSRETASPSGIREGKDLNKRKPPYREEKRGGETQDGPGTRFAGATKSWVQRKRSTPSLQGPKLSESKRTAH